MSESIDDERLIIPEQTAIANRRCERRRIDTDGVSSNMRVSEK
jgi:hypothetical protein